MSAPPAAHVVDLEPADLVARLDEALGIYVRAMEYPPGTARARAPMWREHAHRTGWRGVGALDDAGTLRGVAYGYPGAPGQWWYEEVRRGLARRGGAGTDVSVDPDGWLGDYFELTELHVRPDTQGGRLGEALARRLLARTPSSHVLLSTPESPTTTRAWALYRRLGFVDVLRHHRFSSDPRPFAVLGRELPLGGPDPDADHEG